MARFLQKPRAVFGWLAGIAVIGLGLVVFGQSWFYRNAEVGIESIQPSLRFDENPLSPTFGTIEITGFSKTTLAQLNQNMPAPEAWEKLFAVYVDQAASSANGAVPPVLGTVQIDEESVRFTPRFPLVAGLSYRARVDLPQLLSLAGQENRPLVGVQSTPALEAVFTLPKANSAPSTVVTEVFPSHGELPENLLRFYVHFSAPMQRGQVLQHAKLIGPDGQLVEGAFLDILVELWDPSMRRLTLLLDPGRIKQGVLPNLQVGSPLNSGVSYRLVIDPALKDANGNPLLEGFEKPFTVVAADRKSPDPADWHMGVPAAKTQEPLQLTFPSPLDRALLTRVIRTLTRDGEPVAGTIEISAGETQWRFTPSKPWQVGSYLLRVETILEDLAGNNLKAPFDVDVQSRLPIEKEFFDLSFEII